ncbi:MAG: proprotein convertase P-domain-containing protein, partial [Phycisphaerales bacterium]
DLWLTAATGLIPTGDYRPSAESNAPASLADFRGQPVAGTWTLTVADLSLSDAGSLVSWALEFNPPTVCGSTSDCLADFDGNGIIDPDDLADFIAGFFTDPPDPRCDANTDGTVDPDDLADFIAAFFGPPC